MIIIKATSCFYYVVCQSKVIFRSSWVTMSQHEKYFQETEFPIGRNYCLDIKASFSLMGKNKPSQHDKAWFEEYSKVSLHRNLGWEYMSKRNYVMPFSFLIWCFGMPVLKRVISPDSVAQFLCKQKIDEVLLHIFVQTIMKSRLYT